MNKITFKIENKTSSTEYCAFYNMTTWDLYRYNNSHYSENLENRIEGLKSLDYKKVKIKESIENGKKWFEYTFSLTDLEFLKWKLRLVYYTNNGLIDNYSEDRIPERTDWKDLESLYLRLMDEISNLKN